MALETARFVRINATIGAMAERVGVALKNHLARLVERERQTAQPTEQAPHQAVIDDRLMAAGFVHRITDQAARVLDGLAIGHARLIEKLLGA